MDNERIAIEDAVTMFLNEILIWGRPQSTIAAYNSDLKIFKAFLKEIENGRIKYIKEIKKMHVTGFKSYLEENGYKESSVNRKINCIKRFFRFLKENELIETNFTASIHTSRPQDENIPNVLSQEEVNQILALPYNLQTENWRRDTAMLYILTFIGCRREELLKLNWGDVDLVNKQIKIKRKKTRNADIIPMPERLYNYLCGYYKHVSPESPNEPLFLSQEGNRLSNTAYSSAIRKYIQQSGIKKDFEVTGHSLRHTFCSTLLNQGVPIEFIRQTAGHRDIRTTEKYAKLNTETKKKISETVKYAQPSSLVKEVLKKQAKQNNKSGV